MAQVSKIFDTKSSHFTMLYELNTDECLLSFFSGGGGGGGAEMLFNALSNQYNLLL